MKSSIIGLLLLSVVYGSEVSLKDTTTDESTQVKVTETERANKETVTINVRRVQVDRDQNGGFEDARILKVCTYFSNWLFTCTFDGRNYSLAKENFDDCLWE